MFCYQEVIYLMTEMVNC